MLGRSDDAGVLLDGCRGRAAGVVGAGAADELELEVAGPGVVGWAGDDGAACGVSTLLVGEGALRDSVDGRGSAIVSAGFGVGLMGEVDPALASVAVGCALEELEVTGTGRSASSDWDDSR